MAKSCREAGVAIIGGETAEMPGVYTKGEHDIAGCITGVVEKDKIITGEKIVWKEGDILEIIRLYKNELVSMEKISKLYNTNYLVIKNLLIKNGVEIETKLTAKRASLNKEELLLAIELLKEECTIKQIAEYINKNHIIVSRTLKLNGYNIPKFFGDKTDKFSYVGRYKNWKFRSLMELSFILDNENKNIVSAENIKIPYVIKNKNRNYHPDFLLDGRILIEIKPECNQKRQNVLIKSEAAKIFCKNIGWEYKIISWSIDKNKIKKLFLERDVYFVNKSDEAVFKYLKFTKNEMDSFYGENN